MTQKEHEVVVEAFPSKNGDSFLLKVNDNFFLIDAGYVTTYHNYIKPRLVKLDGEGKRLSRLIISHIDTDHISGSIKFLEENNKKEIIGVDQIWHNSYRNLYSHEKTIELTKRSIQLLDSLKQSIDAKSDDKMISAKQGSSLAALILEGEYKWNSDFKDGVISREAKDKQISDAVNFEIISPNQEKLNALKKFWKKELYKLGFRDKITNDPLFDDAFEFLLLKEKEKYLPRDEKKISKKILSIDDLLEKEFYEDKSVTNGSSIAFVIETEQKRMLFLGDAHPTLISEEIEKRYRDEEFPIYFDLIKVSHHGSFSNNSPKLFQLIDSKNFLISTDGAKHGHPDLSTLAWIISRSSDFERCIHFNYENDGSKFLDNSKWKSQYNYTITVPEQGSSLIISL